MTMAEHLDDIGLRKGIEQGKRAGEREARLKIARAMLENGFDEQTVIALTGIAEEEFSLLRHAAARRSIK
ncbi:hypothetical protein AC791_18070 [Klebsiella sp. RIT-PI-d]|uniref:hypothetical protein n=1 Tax=Klebsiella sp. RIT-PI-d TaxID=1681196 RepID=UPI000675C82F|nr:hypothetical protein [Klebsiella sp. RIT-PI-d]KNC06490.1 hypothetical protein AC791_18070 [Klebsiella sp. RIT-PI-d]